MLLVPENKCGISFDQSKDVDIFVSISLTGKL